MKGPIEVMNEAKKEADKPSVEVVIARIRESHPDIEKIFMSGGCYSFYLILASIFPTAIAYYDGNHIWTWIHDRLYDIRGAISKSEMDNLDYLVRLPHPDHNPGPGSNEWGMSNTAWRGLK